MRVTRAKPLNTPSRRPSRAERVLPAALVLASLAAACAKAVPPPSGVLTTPTGVRSHQATGTATNDTAAGPRATAKSPPPLRPKALVAVTTAGDVQSLDPSTGHPVATLASGATGDEVSLTPDQTQVYFETPTGCFHLIRSIPIGGGALSLVAAGSHPTISPDGTKMAYTVDPLGRGW